MFCDVKAIPSLSCDSDHRMVLAKLKLVVPRKRASKKTQRFRTERLKDEATAQQLADFVANQIPPIESEEQDVEDEWKLLKESMYTAAKYSITLKVKYGTTKKYTDWWNEQVNEAVKTNITAI